MTKVQQKNYLTPEVRYFTALGQIQAKGVLVFDNYPACCGTCSSAEIEQEHPNADYIFFHNSQGRALRFENGMPYNYETEEVEDDDEEGCGYTYEHKQPAHNLYWSHSTLNAAQITDQVFRDNGFTVDWNGTDYRCVTIEFKEWEEKLA